MAWWVYVAAFFAGMFLANFVPHFVKGASGDRFPSPFTRPAGKALSPPLVNALWGLLNLVAGYFLFRAGKVWSGDATVLVVFFVGITLMSIMLSINFAKKDKA
jgi:hypothetical protein